MRSLRERLQDVRGTATAPPPPPAPPPPASLNALEQRLLGEVVDGLTLKERLQRLVSVAAARTGPRRTTTAVPLEDLVRGERIENGSGECWRVERDHHVEDFQGGLPLSRVRTLSDDAVRVLSGEADLAGFDLGKAVFLDTETTGLAGGSGTAAFLVGLGWLDGDRFVIRQYVMRDYHEEAALLAEVAREVRRFEHLVTFNGRSYDVPLLETRFKLNRNRWPLGEARHLDLLHPARRLWKLRLESCRLQVLEARLLGIHRVEDVPGDQIPQIWFDYLRSRDARALARVLEHNRLDILSLAALAVLAAQWVEEDHAHDARDLFSLALVLERAEQHDRSDVHYRRALEQPMPDELRVRTLLRLASRARRRGDHAELVALLTGAAELGDWRAWRGLAVHHEHRTRDLQAALSAADEALRCLDRAGETPGRRQGRDDLLRRRRRLVRKSVSAEPAGPEAVAIPR
jgi:uncharacterized protein YprB with RNaseH-like and TPR domain